MVMALSSAVLGLLALPVVCGGAPCECVWEAADGECAPDTEKVKNAVNDQKMKDYLDMATKGQACAAIGEKTPCSDSDNCAWDESETKCDVNSELAMQMMGMMPGGEGGGIMEMIMKSMECGALGETECGGTQDCEWDEGECSISEEKAIGWLLGGPLASVLPQMMQCQALPDAACGNNDKCAFESGMCDLAPAAAVELFMGGSPIATMMLTMMACEALGTPAACGENSDCAWSPEDGCGVGKSAEMNVMGLVGGYAAVTAEIEGRKHTCAGHTESGDCQSDSNCWWDEPELLRRLAEGPQCEPQLRNEGPRRLDEAPPPCRCAFKQSVADEIKGDWLDEEATCGGTTEEGECTLKANCTWMMRFCMVNPLAGAEGSFADFMQKAQACPQAPSDSACGAMEGCLWENNTCDIDPAESIKLMGLEGMPDGQNLMMKLAACSSFTSASSCNGNSDCSWEDDSCGPSSEVWMQLLMGEDGGKGDGGMTDAMKCGMHPKDECSGDENCEFDEDENECGPSMVGIMKGMFDEGADLDELLKRTSACMEASTQSACSTGACPTSADGARFSAQRSQLLLLGVAFLTLGAKV